MGWRALQGSLVSPGPRAVRALQALKVFLDGEETKEIEDPKDCLVYREQRDLLESLACLDCRVSRATRGTLDCRVFLEALEYLA